MIFPVIITILISIGIYKNVVGGIKWYKTFSNFDMRKKLIYIAGYFLFNLWQLLIVLNVWMMEYVQSYTLILFTILLWCVTVLLLPISMWLYGDVLLIKAECYSKLKMVDEISEYQYGNRLKRYGIFLSVWNTVLLVMVIFLRWYYGEWPMKLQHIVDQSNLL